MRYSRKLIRPLLWLIRPIRVMRLAHELRRMSDRQLADIGLCRNDIGRMSKIWIRSAQSNVLWGKK